MKWKVPLSVRFLVWLVLNLAMLALVFGVVIRTEFRVESLLAVAAGDRVQKVSEVLFGELGSRPQSEWATTLARFSEAYGVRFSLLDDRGEAVAGPALELPAEVQERFRSPRGGPRREGPPSGPGDFGGSGRRSAPGPMRGFIRAGSPPSYWVALPAPIPVPGGGPGRPGRLVIQSPTLTSGGLFFDPRPWWMAGGAVLLLSVLWWIPFIGSITRSLGQMTAATEAIAEGRFNVALNDRRGDELGRLGGAINRMSRRLEGFVTGQKRFLGDIAHELCSPLARMEMALGVLDRRAEGSQREYVGDLQEDVHHMSGLVNELLSFSKAGLKNREIPLERVSLSEVVAGVVSREANGNPVVEVRVPASLTVMAETELLGRALGNLLRNALRYAGHAGPVVLEARQEGTVAVVVVRDQGPGVPEEALARLGEPFFRPDPARARESGGTGLGLAIVRTCVDACQGTLCFRNRKPTGFEAEIRLAAGR